jgi:5-methylcytosine-specific restriction endonuclease McrA
VPHRLCLEPRCPEPATWRGRCPVHRTQRNRETRSKNAKVYNTKRWRLLRRRKLFLTPLCECGCDRIATDVHHIKDIEQGGDPWSLDNLESLTHECHARITRARQQGV